MAPKIFNEQKKIGEKKFWQKELAQKKVGQRKRKFWLKQKYLNPKNNLGREKNGAQKFQFRQLLGFPVGVSFADAVKVRSGKHFFQVTYYTPY